LSRKASHNEFFQELEQRMQSLSPPADLGIRRDRLLILGVAIGSVLAFIPWRRFVEPDIAVWFSVIGLVIQLIGAILLAYRQVRDLVPEFQDSKRKFALQLDQHFIAREHLLAWLRTFSADIRGSRLRYVTSRLASLRSRYAIAFGAVDKFGVLPVLVGLFVQVQGIASLSWSAKLLGVAIIALYLMSLWMAGYREQLEGYERVLHAANE
jgi:hypothetical protein